MLGPGPDAEPWEVAYFNGAAILDTIPVKTRDSTDQVVFRDGKSGSNQAPGGSDQQQSSRVDPHATQVRAWDGGLSSRINLPKALLWPDEPPFFSFVLVAWPTPYAE